MCNSRGHKKVLPNKLLNIKSITLLPGFMVLRLSKGVGNANEKQKCEKPPPVYEKNPPVYVPSRFTNPALERCLKLMLKIIFL